MRNVLPTLQSHQIFFDIRRKILDYGVEHVIIVLWCIKNYKKIFIQSEEFCKSLNFMGKKKKKSGPPTIQLPVDRPIDEELLQKMVKKHGVRTAKQISVVREILRNPTRPRGHILRAAGYAPVMAFSSHGRDIVQKSTIEGAIADYLKNCKFNAKIASTYTRIFDLHKKAATLEDEISVHKLQLQASDQLLKINGDYAAKRVEKKELHGFVDFGTAIAPSNPVANSDGVENIFEGEIAQDLGNEQEE